MKIKVIRIQSRICIGGPVLHNEILCRKLPAYGYQCILVGGSVEKSEYDLYNHLREQGIDIRILGSMKRHIGVFADIKSFFQLYQLIRREKPSIVHTHTAKAGAIGRLAAFLARVPVIFHTFHGHVFEGYFSRPITLLFIQIERFLARMSDCIIALSPSQKRDLVETYRITKPQKVRVIPLGFHLDRFVNLVHGNQLKCELGIPSESKLLGIVGRLVPIKNITMALAALKDLLDKGLNAYLCVIGDGEEKNRLQNLSRELGVEKFVHWLGWVHDIECIYSGLDALLLTSNNEGTPVTIIEAFASRVPVVATRVGGVPDLLNNDMNGWGSPAGDKDELVRQLWRIFHDEHEKNMRINNAFRFALKEYHYEFLVRRIDALNKEFLIKKGSSFV